MGSNKIWNKKGISSLTLSKSEKILFVTQFTGFCIINVTNTSNTEPLVFFETSYTPYRIILSND